MKRQYRDIRFRPERLERIQRAARIIEDYETRGFVMSVRQVYYIMVSRDLIPNHDKMYQQLVADISDGRLAGLISWTSIEDRNRTLRGNAWWNSPQDCLRAAERGYRLDKWASQPWRPQVWVEKRALEGVVGSICARLDVDYIALGGYNSSSEQWRAGRMFAHYISKGQRPIVFHLGDHDPSGIDMTRDNAERLEMFAGVPVMVQRLALNMDQVRRFRPPPNPAKITDSRFEDYKRTYDTESSWEVDALPPEVLQSLIQDAIMRVRDEALWEVALAEENADRLRMADAIEGL